MNGMNGTNTIGGLLAPSNMGGRGAQHSRAVSLPVFTQAPNMPAPVTQQPQYQSNGYTGMNSGLGGYGMGNSYGLAINDGGHTGLQGWAEEELGVQ
jgi:hypothetical protein